MPATDAYNDLLRLLAPSAPLADGLDAAPSVLFDSQAQTLWTSPTGVVVAERLSAEARRHVSQWASSRPVGTVQLARMRFDDARGPQLLTCSTAALPLADGRQGLLVQVLGPLPASWRRGPVKRSLLAETASRSTSDDGADPIQRLERLAASRATQRFVWRTNADGTFMAVSAELAQAVGAAGAVEGRSWDDMRDVVTDPTGHVAAALAGGETWSGARVQWRVGASQRGVTVELGGTPLRSPDGRLEGQRGFGILRLHEMADADWPRFGVAAATSARPTEEKSAVSSSRSRAKPEQKAAPVVSLRGYGIASSQADDALSAFRSDPPAAPHAPTMLPRAAQLAAPQTPSRAQARPTLSAGDRHALREIARALGARLDEPPAEARGQGGDAGQARTAERSTVETALGPVKTAPLTLPFEADAYSETERELTREPQPAPLPDTKPGLVATQGERADLAARLDSNMAEGAEPPAETSSFPVENGSSPVEMSSDAAQSSPEPAADHPETPSPAPAAASAPVAGEPTSALPSPSQIESDHGSDPDEAASRVPTRPVQAAASIPTAANDPAAGPGREEAMARALLDRLPLAIMVNRGEDVLFANRAFLAIADHANLEALQNVGLDQVFGGPVTSTNKSAVLTLIQADGTRLPIEAALTPLEWRGKPATLISARAAGDNERGGRTARLEAELTAREHREAELTAILDTATDGVVLVDDRGRILSLNRSAEALFGYEQSEVLGESLAFLLAPGSHGLAFDYLEGLKSSSMASVLNDGREVTGRVRQGGYCPLFMTLGRVGDGPDIKYCAVLRDLTAWKTAEGELLEAKRLAERASAHKSDFLAKMSHEVRTPLNAMIGFAEVMLEERFGPIGNDRYREYIRDIHASGGHVISLVNDLLDLAKVEAGKLDLDFTSVHLNALVTSCVALMQPQASRDRVILRSSLAPRLPPIVADERSMRQIVLNIVSNALKFTEAGGQVIISTAQTDRGDVVVRVRDTGVGMSKDEVEAALEPFRQLATTRRSPGTGLGLPLTKALAEANRGTLTITSQRNDGTMVEIVMPATRVLAE